MNKQDFLKSEFIPFLKTIAVDTAPLFGKMNVHQMIEHMGYAFTQASGLVPLAATNNEDITKKMYDFMMSDRPFKDNTPNPYLPDEPSQPASADISEALLNLQHDIDLFFATFENDPEKRILNPFFGILNFEEWQHLLHKHALHHLRQFGVQP